MVQLLIENKADVKIRGHGGRTPLINAAYNGKYSFSYISIWNNFKIQMRNMTARRGSGAESIIKTELLIVLP